MTEKTNLAIRLLQEMDYNRGIDLLEEVLAEEPENEMALYNIGLAYNCTDKPENAIKTFNYYLKNFDPNPNVLAGLGFSYYLTGELEKAKTTLEQAVALDGDNVYALLNFGGVLAELGETDKAKNTFHTILQLSPNDSKALTGMGVLLFNEENFTEAEEYFFHVLSLNIPDEEKEKSKEYLTKVAEKTLKKQGFRIDAVMHLAEAIDLFDSLDRDGVQKIAFEIATLGQKGFDINNPDKAYHVPSLNKEISGLCALCHMYAGFKIIDPSADVGVDFSDEYEQAKKVISSRRAK